MTLPRADPAPRPPRVGPQPRAACRKSAMPSIGFGRRRKKRRSTADRMAKNTACLRFRNLRNFSRQNSLKNNTIAILNECGLIGGPMCSWTSCQRKSSRPSSGYLALSKSDTARQKARQTSPPSTSGTLPLVGSQSLSRTMTYLARPQAIANLHLRTKRPTPHRATLARQQELSSSRWGTQKGFPRTILLYMSRHRSIVQ